MVKRTAGVFCASAQRPGPSGGRRRLKTTWHFDNKVLSERPYVRLELCERVVQNPIRREIQTDGRIRYWGIVNELGGRVLRVVTLADDETVHTAFLDRGFRREGR